MTLEERVVELERQLREHNALLVRVLNYARVGANYHNENLRTQVEGIQANLKRMADEEPRLRGRRK